MVLCPKQVGVNFEEALFFQMMFSIHAIEIYHLLCEDFPVPHSFPGYSRPLFPLGLTMLLYILHHVTHNNLLHVWSPLDIKSFENKVLFFCVFHHLAQHMVHSTCSICSLNGWYSLFTVVERGIFKQIFLLKLCQANFRPHRRKRSVNSQLLNQRLKACSSLAHRSLIWLLINNLLHSQKGSF